MNKTAVYDTRFFIQLYRTTDEEARKKIRVEMTRKEKYVSSVVIYELYNNSIEIDERETAKTKVAYVKQDFNIISVDCQVAEVSAEFRHKYHISMGDSIIAATALMLKAVCITDDQHIKQIKEIQTSWI